MARTGTRNGQRCLAIALALAALVTGAWFLPELPGRTIEAIEMPPSDSFASDQEHITVFRSAEELRQALPPHGSHKLSAVNWDSTDLVRVRCRAVGYRTEGDNETRYGTVEHSARLGGHKLFVYLYEPTPYLLWGPVSSAFSQFHREAWFAAPKGTRVEWGSGARALHDLGFAAATMLLAFAFVRVVFRLRRRSADLEINQAGWQSTLPAIVPSH